MEIYGFVYNASSGEGQECIVEGAKIFGANSVFRENRRECNTNTLVVFMLECCNALCIGQCLKTVQNRSVPRFPCALGKELYRQPLLQKKITLLQ